jgi:hypothetical protein
MTKMRNIAIRLHDVGFCALPIDQGAPSCQPLSTGAGAEDSRVAFDASRPSAESRRSFTSQGCCPTKSPHIPAFHGGIRRFFVRNNQGDRCRRPRR